MSHEVSHPCSKSCRARAPLSPEPEHPGRLRLSGPSRNVPWIDVAELRTEATGHISLASSRTSSMSRRPHETYGPPLAPNRGD